ncbi:MAG: metallophosphoesterase [Roseburia sp.]|nr:metallophosphoesterase [Roseburia sp.]
MIKIFVTGDNHFGKKYDRYPEIRDRLVDNRFVCFEKMVEKAEQEGCDIFAVTGDLFDNCSSIRKSDVERVVRILAGFAGRVLVLPGNHDYYTGEEKVWKDFDDALRTCDNNIIRLDRFEPYPIEIAEETVVIYPAFCRSKHSRENNLGWIKKMSVLKSGQINVGMAHGAIEGVTPDMQKEYFLMTEPELQAIPMDVWLVGHTHIPYPGGLSEDEEIGGYRIFNAGTHAQTDLHNNTRGYGFIISVDKQGDKAQVSAKKYQSGTIFFYDIAVRVSSAEGDSLEALLQEKLDPLEAESVVRLTVAGSVFSEEYSRRRELYKKYCDRFLSWELQDDELHEEITLDRVREEFAESSFAAKLMEALQGDQTELQMAYELLQECSRE